MQEKDEIYNNNFNGYIVIPEEKSKDKKSNKNRSIIFLAVLGFVLISGYLWE